MANKNEKVKGQKNNSKNQDDFDQNWADLDKEARKEALNVKKK